LDVAAFFEKDPRQTIKSETNDFVADPVTII
jgi:hypothetical protein